jgi:hypothetical protein
MRFSAWVLVALTSLAAGCAVGMEAGPPATAVAEDGTVYPTVPPPDPIPELAPPSPGYDYVWINGYWDWNGADWIWYSGYWVPRAQASIYVAPRFVFLGGRPVYYRPYWRGEHGRRAYGYGWRGAPPPAYRARPQVPPASWRAQHNQGWRGAPGAGGWRGSPAPAPAHGGGWRGSPGAAPSAAPAGGWRGNPAPRGPAPAPGFHGGPPGAHPAAPAPAPHPGPAPGGRRSGGRGGHHR